MAVGRGSGRVRACPAGRPELGDRSGRHAATPDRGSLAGWWRRAPPGRPWDRTHPSPRAAGSLVCSFSSLLPICAAALRARPKRRLGGLSLAADRRGRQGRRHRLAVRLQRRGTRPSRQANRPLGSETMRRCVLGRSPVSRGFMQGADIFDQIVDLGARQDQIRHRTVRMRQERPERGVGHDLRSIRVRDSVGQWLISSGTGAWARRCSVTPPRKRCRNRLCV